MPRKGPRNWLARSPWRRKRIEPLRRGGVVRGGYQLGERSPCELRPPRPGPAPGAKKR